MDEVTQSILETWPDVKNGDEFVVLRDYEFARIAALITDEQKTFYRLDEIDVVPLVFDEGEK